MSKIEKICPFCQNEYCGADISIPGIFRGVTYDDSSDHFAQYPTVPDVLYHYTTLDSLKKILDASSTVLRATHYSQMNDWKEIEIGYEILYDKLQAEKPFENEKVIFDLLNEIKNKMKHCYLISFSKNADTLSQWRAYTSTASGGVCIGFYSKSLQTDRETFYLSPCSYTKCINSSSLIDCGSIIDIAKYRVSNEGQKNIEIQSKKDEMSIQLLLAYGGKLTTINCLDDLEAFVTTVKHHGFYEEQEWRLIAVRPNIKKYPEKLSDKNKRFIEFPFKPVSAISKIIISPHGDKNKIRNVIECYKNKGILSEDCEVIDSQIPYRGE